jgi:NAD(P)-dependent dehydrogenase (short-subunit alcohol dehydrogenase family)
VSGGDQPGAGAADARRALEGRVAIVTGAAKGLGAGIAHRLAAEGARVACADILDTEELVAALTLPAAGGEHLSGTVDVSSVQQVERFVSRVVERHGRIDVLVNNAATIQPLAPLLETPDDVVERVLAVNVRGVFSFARAAGQFMREQGAGRIVNIGSLVAKDPWPGLAVYAASKAAVIALTQAMALELAASGVLVNCVCPGTMDTDQMRSSFEGIARERGVSIEQAIAEKRASMPLGRLGTAADAAAIVAWLASDEASFTTGATINLTGGESVVF